MDACTKCKSPASSLRAIPSARGAEALCPPCYAAWAEFQLEAFPEEVFALHAAAHGGDPDARPEEQLRACRWDACQRAGRLATARALAA